MVLKVISKLERELEVWKDTLFKLHSPILRNPTSCNLLLESFSVRSVEWQGKHLYVSYTSSQGRIEDSLFLFILILQERDPERLKDLFRRVKLISVSERRFNICGVLNVDFLEEPSYLKVTYSVNEDSLSTEKVDLRINDLRGNRIIHYF